MNKPNDRISHCDKKYGLPFDEGKMELLAQDIRSHPKKSNMLIVSLTIMNIGMTHQAYPGIQIQFLDLEGKIVTMRRFKPEEYLETNQSINGMKPNTPIHVTFEASDPGSKAVNFETIYFDVR